jgi:hypothetical protein
MPPLAAVPDLDHELDDLYGRPLEEFTRARNDLVRRLKRAHQAEAAAQVQALRKPSATAWAANHLARVDPDGIRRLLDAGARLQEAQARALAGDAGPSEIADASTEERAAVRALVAEARSELGVRATAALIERLGQTLRAAATDAEARALLEQGRLTEEVHAVGFGPLTAVPSQPKRRAATRRERQERVRRLREEARRLDREAAAAERAADDAEREARRLRQEAAARRESADRAAAEAAEAERSVV